MCFFKVPPKKFLSLSRCWHYGPSVHTDSDIPICISWQTLCYVRSSSACRQEHHRLGTCLYPISATLAFHVSMPPQSAPSHHIPSHSHTCSSNLLLYLIALICASASNVWNSDIAPSAEIYHITIWQRIPHSGTWYTITNNSSA